MTRRRVLDFSRRQLLIVCALFVFALLLRVPNLMTIPRLTDEYLEVGWAVSMVQQNVLPLTSVDAYDGPLFPYALAFLFRTIGFNLYLPRVFMLFVGALTIVATFFLAKELARGDWRGGLLAALLLSANAHHILYNSHVAWSNDTTPLFTTLALLAYLRATRASQPRWLLAAGVLYGLALQTHPSVLALAPPLALDFLIEGRTRSWLKTWVPYAAVTLALVVYSPVLYYNLASGGGSFQRVAQRVMAFETHPTLSSTRDHLVPLITVLPRVSFGTFGSVGGDALFDPSTILFWIFTLGAMMWLLRDGEKLPILILAASLLLIAVFNRNYFLPGAARYFIYLLPLVYASWAIAVLRVWDRLAGTSRSLKWLGRASLVGVVILLIVTSLLSLNSFYVQAQASGDTNVAFLDVVKQVQQTPGAIVLIDSEIALPRVGGRLLYLFDLARVKYEFVSTARATDVTALQARLRGQQNTYLIALPRTVASLGSELSLRSLLMVPTDCPSCISQHNFALWK